jgi:hypothetical protein
MIFYEKLKVIPLRSEKRQECPLHYSTIQHRTGSPSQTNQARKGNKIYPN